ncbi:hypothetical protein [Roseicella aerolata]|uniref:Uncharacterized protein n=1 Tax=Roseicella aerolata TaxID=2883479 RepID=A0A9X1IFS0_9PROT|nr:hypothetical protein [Roseicella aerolata]MCB4822568.1 hypothetical protein [Roseicella aerolata]
MSASLPVALSDTLVGTAVPQAGRLRFTAADPRLANLDGAFFDSAAAARRMAETVLTARAPLPNGGPVAGRALLALLRQG